MIRYFTLLLLLCCSLTVFGQKKEKHSRAYREYQSSRDEVKESKYPSFFGLQFRPIFATNFLTASKLDLKGNELTANYHQLFGYTFGGTIKIGLSKIINLETGLNFVQRNYSIDFSIHSATTNIPDAKTDFRIISYDVPINALFYIKLSDKFYMNASLGASVAYFPTNVWKRYIISSVEKFEHFGNRFSKFYMEANANVGFEYRSKKAGSFYIGASIKVPFKPIFQISAVYTAVDHQERLIGNVSGSYLTADFRYYFPNFGKRGGVKGPIEQ